MCSLLATPQQSPHYKPMLLYLIVLALRLTVLLDVGFVPKIYIEKLEEEMY